MKLFRLIYLLTCIILCVRPRVEVDIYDSSGSLSATVFGGVAEKLFARSATDFMKVN